MSQSAVSRQVSGLEQDLGVALFHRHARGLILTEQGEHLFRTVNDVMLKLEGVRSRLAESSEKPTGPLRLTTTVGLGSTWLTDRIHEFIDLYPDVRLQLILDDEELDLGMREADVAIRLRQPTQPDLIQRRLFTVHMHLYAAPSYSSSSAARRRSPNSTATASSPSACRCRNYLKNLNWLEIAGREPRQPAHRRSCGSTICSRSRTRSRAASASPSCPTTWSATTAPAGAACCRKPRCRASRPISSIPRSSRTRRASMSSGISCYRRRRTGRFERLQSASVADLSHTAWDLYRNALVYGCTLFRQAYNQGVDVVIRTSSPPYGR